jgi:hypothetical protein
MICRSGSQIRSTVFISLYSLCRSSTTASDSSTSRTAWWNSVSPRLRRSTSS